MTLIARRSGSGPILRPLEAEGEPNWDASAPAVFELMPAGHKPGIYRVILSVYVKTTGGGTVDALLGWGQPLVGATTLNVVSVASLAAAVYSGIAFRALASNGVEPITVTYNPVAKTGSPRVQLANAAFIETLFPEGRV